MTRWEQFSKPERSSSIFFLPEKIREGAIPGWRVWKYTDIGFILSLSAEHKWQSPVMRAKSPIVGNFDISNVPVSTTRSRLGVFSYKRPSFLWDRLLARHIEDAYLLSKSPQAIIAYPIIGRIDNTGEVYEHQFGLRAEVTTIRELWVLKQIGSIALSEMEKRYQCEVHQLKNDLAHVVLDSLKEEEEKWKSAYL